jgi:hypothetical protein
VAREYLGREDGRLFYAPDPNPEEPFVARQPLDRDAMVRIFLQIFLYQDGQIRGLQDRVGMTALRKIARHVYHAVVLILLVWAGIFLLSTIINR